MKYMDNMSDTKHDVLEKLERIEKLLLQHNEMMKLLTHVSNDPVFISNNKEEYNKLQKKLFTPVQHN